MARPNKTKRKILNSLMDDLKTHYSNSNGIIALSEADMEEKIKEHVV